MANHILSRFLGSTNPMLRFLIPVLCYFSFSHGYPATHGYPWLPGYLATIGLPGYPGSMGSSVTLPETIPKNIFNGKFGLRDPDVNFGIGIDFGIGIGIPPDPGTQFRDFRDRDPDRTPQSGL